MKITAIDCSELECERFIADRRVKLSRVFLRISTDRDATGVSLWRGGAGSFITQYFKPILVGEDPSNIERIWNRLYATVRLNLGYTAVSALGAVDAALWDLLGKLTGMPVYKLLGGYRDKVQVYGDGIGPGGIITNDMEPLMETVRKYVRGGYKALKVHQSYSDIDTSIAEIGQLREALGDDVALMIDANCYWSQEMAIKAARAMERYNVYWLEDPVYVDDYVHGCRMVRLSTRIPITAGERMLTMYDCRNLIEKGSVDIINFDPIISGGGLTPWVKIAAMANLYNVLMAPHGSQWPEVTSQLTAAVSNGLFVPMHPTFHPIAKIDRWIELYREPIEAKDGYLELPSKPGLGVEFNDTAIEDHTVAKYN